MIVITDSNRLGTNSDRLPSPTPQTAARKFGHTGLTSPLYRRRVSTEVMEEGILFFFFFDYDPKMLDSVGVFK